MTSEATDERPSDRYHRNDDGGGYAPEWVQSVPLHAIADQRAKGWPDFHPEDFCHICGQRNPVWHAQDDAWEAVHPEAVGSDGGGICCPSCFAVAYWRATGKHPVWDFTIRAPEDGDQ